MATQTAETGEGDADARKISRAEQIIKEAKALTEATGELRDLGQRVNRSDLPANQTRSKKQAA